MTFKIASTRINTAVVSTGTITFSYPDNTSAGNFAAYGHKLHVDKHQKLYSQPNDFTVSFGASSITVTYNGSTTIPAGATVKLQANIEGTDDGVLVTQLAPDIHSSTLGEMVKVDLGSPDTADADGYCVSQNLTALGVFSSSVTATAAIAAAALGGIADVPRNVVAAWTTNAVLTITGTDEYGNTIVEKSAGGAATFTGKKAFKTVTGIASDTNITALTVGTGTVLGLPFFVGDAGQVIGEYEAGVRLVRKNGKVYLTGTILEAAVDAATPFNIVSPIAGTIKRLTTMCAATVTTGGDFTVEVNTVAVDGLAVTVANSSAEGDMDTDTPTAGHATTAVAVGDRIEIIAGSAFNAAADFYFVLEIEASATQQLNGTFVAGVSSKATATTGDVRGTYTPVTTPDGATSETLIILTTDPKFLGTSQYAG